MERYYVPTTGRTWESGTFGLVRNEGWRFHEGIDVRPLTHDARGEPTDPVVATADGVVAYVNDRSPLSNYGKYVVIRHQIDGLEVYSLYGHLSQTKVAIRQQVSAGQVIGIMGRTTNTRDRIGPERAHVHFELDLLLNDRFPAYFKQYCPGERNDHGLFNGQNLMGLDPREVLLLQRRPRFSLLEYARNQTELCRVWVRKNDLSFARRYPLLVRRNPRAEKEGVAGYEIAFNYYGLPFQLTPRAPSEAQGFGRVALLSVNAAEQRRNPGRRMVEGSGNHWTLGKNGTKLVELLTY
jgi:hypothetical protein